MPHLEQQIDSRCGEDDNIYLSVYSESQTESLSQQGSFTSTQSSTVAKSRQELMTDIEQTIEEMMTCNSLGEPIRFIIATRRSKSTSRTLSLSSAGNARLLACYLSVMQMIYEAIAHKIIVTKRDIYYRDVALFGSQKLVDNIVDDISCHYNVPRSSLNVSAASKGLIFGPIIIKLRNSKFLDCMSIHPENECADEQGTLIPPISQVAQVQCKAKCMIVIEKEATFRYLVSVGFCHSLPQSCVLVTGKGYPDLSTRQFVKYFSNHYSHLPVFALMDNDPHGLDIFACYKWGARAFAFDMLNLAVKDIELIGLTCQDRIDFQITQESRIPMTERDVAKLLAMSRTSVNEVPGTSQLRNRGWAEDISEQLASQGHQTFMKEIQSLLKSDYKFELQALNHAGPYGLTNYLLKKLAKHNII